MPSSSHRHSSYIPRDGYKSDDDGRGRRHRSSPKSNRARSSMTDDNHRRPKLERDESYYNPRDKYYLSGDEEPEERSSSRPRGNSRGRDPGYHVNHPSAKHHERSRGRRSQSLDNHAADPDPYYHDRPSSRHSAGNSSGSHRRRSTTPSSRYSSPQPSKDDGDRRGRYYPPSSSRSPRGRASGSSAPPSRTSRSKPPLEKRINDKADNNIWMGAARTALEAGAVAAVKLRNDPSPWIGMKGTKVATTAIGAALVDTLVDKRYPKVKGGMRHAVAKQATQVALANLVAKPAAKGTKLGRKSL